MLNSSQNVWKFAKKLLCFDWLTDYLDFWTRTHEDYFVIEDSIEKIMVKIVITSILKFWGIMLKCFVFLCQNLWCISV